MFEVLWTRVMWYAAVNLSSSKFGTFYIAYRETAPEDIYRITRAPLVSPFLSVVPLLHEHRDRSTSHVRSTAVREVAGEASKQDTTTVSEKFHLELERRRSPFPSVRRPRFTHRAARLPLEPPRSVLGAAPWTLSHLTRTRPAARAPRCCYTGFSALARLANQQRVCGPPTVIVA